jgi:hypothetical protein
MGHSPASLRMAAAVQAAESAVVLVAAILAGIDAATGRSYHQNSGIALTVIGVAAAAALALVAAGLARARRWSRTPALLTQLFFGIVGIYLVQSRRLDWGVVSIVLAVAGFATLLAPPSLRALAGQEETPTEPPRTGQNRTEQNRTEQNRTEQNRTEQTRTEQTRTEPGPGGGASRRRSARPGAE